jgi:DNA polymerase-3 subunit beta
VKLRLDRAALADAVAWAARALPPRPARPALAGIMLTAAGRTLTVAAFDFEVSTTFEAPAEVGTPGTALVPGRLLADLCRALPDQPVQLTSDAAQTVLTCGAAQFALPRTALDEYPRPPHLPLVRGSVDATAFAAAVTQVAVAAARDDTLPVLTGIRLEINAERLRLVATDRYRLAVRDLPWQPAHPAPTRAPAAPAESAEAAAPAESAEVTALVPARSLHDLAKALARADHGQDDRVTIALQAQRPDAGGLIGLRAGARRATVRLLDTDYLNYEAIFPTTYTGTATVERLPLLDAAKRIALVADRHLPLRLTLEPGRLTLDAGHGSQAHGRESLPSAYQGEPISLAANAAYLVEGITALDTPVVELAYTTATKPAVLTGRATSDTAADPAYRYLFMPLRPA